jgi:hypothetical protein
LAAIVLQNRRGLDLITVEKGGICVFLGEECCFYANQSGTVRENACQLLERIKARKRNKEIFWNIRWLPMGSPPGRPTYCAPYAITLRALCDKPPHQVHSQPDEH